MAGKMQGGSITNTVNNVINVSGKEKIASLEGSIKNISTALNALNSMSAGDSRTLQYYKDEVSLINQASAAAKEFNNIVSSGNNWKAGSAATDLLNIFNALQARSKSSDIFSSLDSSIQEAISKAQELDGVMDKVISSSKFANAFDAFDTLNQSMTGAGELIQKIFSGMDASNAIQQIDHYKNLLLESQSEIANLQEQLNLFQGTDIGNALDQLEAYRTEISQLESQLESMRAQFTQSGVDSFASFLRSNKVISSGEMTELMEGFNLGGSYRWDINEVQSKINELVESIRQGTMSADDAISQFKQSFSNLLEGGGINTSDLDAIKTAIEGTVSSMTQMGSVNLGGEATQIQELLAALKSGGDISVPQNMESFVASLREIAGLNFEGGIDSVRRLMTALQGEVQVKEGSLAKIAQGLVALTEFDPGNLAVLSSLNFDGLNNLKVSKASLSNLAAFLPEIANVNVEALSKVASLDFSNLSNIKLNKSQMEGLSALTSKSDFASLASTLENLAASITSALERIGNAANDSKQKLASMADPMVSAKMENLEATIIGLELRSEEFAQKGINIDTTKLNEIRAAFDALEASLSSEDGMGFKKFSEQFRLITKDASTFTKMLSNFGREAKLGGVGEAFESDAQRISSALSKIESGITDAKKKLQDWSMAKFKAPADYQALQEVVSEYQNLMRNAGNMSGEQLSAEIERIGQKALTASNNIKMMGADTATLGTKISRAVKGYAAMFTGTMAIMRVVQYTKQAVQATIELDSAMTQLQIVTKASDAEMSSYADSIVEVANQTASSVKDMVDATTTFSRLGYGLEDATELGRLSAQIQNVGNIDTQASQDAMTAIIKAYGFQVDEMESVMDKLVEVGNNAPISVSQLAEGLNNASAILATATDSTTDSTESFKQSVAMLTAANTTIQNISKSSTALRTIIARIRKVDTELDELGEVMTSADYDKLTQALTDQNVALTDEQGELRNTYDVLQDLSEAWKTMTANEKASLAQMFGSTRNQNVFTGLMENFDEATTAMGLMENSENALSEANDVYLQSIQAHIQSLKNAFDTLLFNDSITGFITEVIDAGQGILKVIGSIIDGIEKIGGVKTVLGSVVPLLISAFSSKIITGIQSFVSNLKNVNSLFPSLRANVTGYTASQNAANTAMSSGATAATGLASALGLIGAAIAVANLVASVVDGIVKSFQEAEEVHVEVMSNKEIASEQENLDKLYSRYIELTNQVSLTTSEKQELESVTSQLLSQLGLERDAIADSRGAFDAYKQSIAEAVKEKKDFLISEASLNLSQSEKALTTAATLEGTQLVAHNSTKSLWGTTYLNNPEDAMAYFRIAKEGNKDLEKQISLLEDAGFAVTNLGYDYALTFGNVNMNDANSVVAYVENLETALSALSTTDVTSDLYKSLKVEYQYFQQWISQYRESIDMIKSLSISEAIDQAMANPNLDTSNLEEYRYEVIRNAARIVDANDNISMSSEEVVLAVDDMLRLRPEFQGFYAAMDGSSAVDSTSNSLENLKKTLSSLSKALGDDNIFDIMLRPNVDTSELKKAGWNIDNVDPSSMFIKTFSNEDDTLAINFTPVIRDKYGRVTDILSPKELERYAKNVIDGVHEDYLNLQIMSEVKTDDSGAKAEAEKLKNTLENTLSQLRAKYNPEQFEPLLKGLHAVEDATARAKGALDELNESLSEPDYNEGLEARMSNFEKFYELYENGDFGSKDYAAYAKYFGFVDANGKPLSPEEMGQTIEGYKQYVGWFYDTDAGKYTTDAETAMLNFLRAIDSNEGTLVKFGEDGEAALGVLVNWDEEAGRFNFDPEMLFNPDKMQAVADILGLTAENFTDLMNMVRYKSPDWTNFSETDLDQWLVNAELVDKTGEKIVTYTDRIKDFLEASGYFKPEEIEAIMQQVHDLYGEADIEIGIDIDPADTPDVIAGKIQDVLDQVGGVEANIDVAAEWIADIEDEEVRAQVIAELSNSEEFKQELTEAVQNVDAAVEMSEGDKNDDVKESVTTVHDMVADMDNHTFTFTLKGDNLDDTKTTLEDIQDILGDIGTVSANTKTVELSNGRTFERSTGGSDESTQQFDIKFNVDDDAAYQAISDLLQYLEDQFESHGTLNIKAEDKESRDKANDLVSYIDEQRPEIVVSTNTEDAYTDINDLISEYDGKSIKIDVTTEGANLPTEIGYVELPAKAPEAHGEKVPDISSVDPLLRKPSFDIATWSEHENQLSDIKDEYEEVGTASQETAQTIQTSGESAVTSLEGLKDIDVRSIAEDLQALGDNLVTFGSLNGVGDEITGELSSVLEQITSSVENGDYDVKIPISPDTVGFIQSIIDGTTNAAPELQAAVASIFPQLFPDTFTIPDVDASNVTEAINQATEDADATVTIEAETSGDISLGELGSIDSSDQTSALESVSSAASSAAEQLQRTNMSMTDLGQQQIETSDKVSSLDALKSALQNGGTASDETSGKIRNLSSTPVESGNKTGPLQQVAGAARNASGAVQNLIGSLLSYNSTPASSDNKIAAFTSMVSAISSTAGAIQNATSALQAWNATPVEQKQVSASNATGTKNAKAGMSLLGDEYSPSGAPKPELVVSNGQAYLAGVHGPTIGYLHPGDVVYTYDETKRILKGAGGSISGPINAFYGGGTIDVSKINYKGNGSSSGIETYNDNSTNTYNYNVGGGSGASSSSDSSEEEPKFEWVDWIEKAIDRAERAINRVKKVAESTYKSLSTRLSATKDEIGLVTDEINLQQRAYDRYIQQANSVGLSSDLAKKVRDGAIDINEYDEDTRELISDYQEWWKNHATVYSNVY